MAPGHGTAARGEEKDPITAEGRQNVIIPSANECAESSAGGFVAISARESVLPPACEFVIVGHRLQSESFTIETDQVRISVTGLIAAVGLILLVLGIGRIRLRWLAGGAALLAVAALQGAMTEEEAWESIEIVTLRLRVADASGRPVVPTRVQIGRPGGGRNSISTIGPDGVALVSAMVETGGSGSVGRQLERAHPQVDLGAYQLEVLADGFHPWRTPLARLLPRDWPLITPQGTTEVRLERAP